MKKLLFMSLASLLAWGSAQAATVKVTMNNTSPKMALAEKQSGKAVELDAPAGNVYTFEAAAGHYVLTAYNRDSTVTSGTIVISVTDEAEQAFNVFTCTAYATNKDWAFDTDYTMEADVVSREGQKQEITIGSSVTAGRKTFLALSGNTYYVALIPSAEHQAEGYMTLYKSGTVTFNVNAYGAIPMGADYSVTVPADAEFELATKTAHFISFNPVEPTAVTTEGGQKKLTYRLADKQVYNYRTWKQDGLTQAGYFTMQLEEDKVPQLAFTEQDYAAFSPKTVNHDVQSNQGYETGDIFVNVNERGHLRLNVGDTFMAHAMRSWELTDNSTNNYFIEPDFHYTVVGLDGKPSTGVITIDNADTTTNPWSTIKAVGKGTALVLVTYDAIGLNYYASGKTEKTPYLGGEYWGAIWPENTAVYVVTVGEAETAIDPNMTINEAYNEDAKKLAGKYVDAEHDVFYYLDTEEGFSYTFTPTGVATVELAYPNIGEQTATYSGFGTDGVTKNDDGSYTLLLKEGRQIVRLADEGGSAVYQVLTAKTCHRDIVNVSREGSSKFIAGDRVKVQYSGLRHPANKMAGIYNMSAYVTYNGKPNGTALILGANQYTFGSAASAQAVSLDLTEEMGSELVLSEGVIQVNGFGDPIGNHRNTSSTSGRSPNFTAVAHKTYFGALPDVRIPIAEATQFTIRLTNDVEGATYTLKYQGTAMEANEDGTYTGTYGQYELTAEKAGYRCFRQTYTIGDDAQGEQTFNVVMTKAADDTWDGSTLTEPAMAEEVYQISNAAELAWYASDVNAGNTQTKAVLTADIDLGDYAWTPIGGATTTKAYQGQFDGQGHTVSGLYINNAEATYQALFGYLKDATVSGVTVEGQVTAKQYVAGVAANVGANATLDRCANHAMIKGSGTFVGGLTGYVSTATSVITNSLNTGVVSGTSSCGGVAGANNAQATITNVYNTGIIEGQSVAAIVGANYKKDNVSNAFATAEYQVTGGQTTVTMEQMQSGEVAYRLGEAFGQIIGEDPLPVIGGEKVFKVSYTSNLSEASDSIYTNGTLPELEPVSGLYAQWLTAEDGEPVSTVTADAELYVNYEAVVTDEKVADFEDLVIGTEGHMSVSEEEDDEREFFVSGTYKFYTGCMSDYDYWYWFGYANEKDNTYTTIDDQWKNIVGGGHNGSTAYGVSFAAPFNGPCFAEVMHNSTGNVVKGFYVTNSAYAYTSMTTGDAYAKKFQKGDWFLLTMTGYDVDGNVTGKKDYYLADLRDADPANHFFINDWRYVDLSGLGKVKKIEFALSSSDSSAWGMNTPGYFCFDDFGAEGTEVLPEGNITTAISSALRSAATAAQRFDLSGRQLRAGAKGLSIERQSDGKVVKKVRF